MSHLADEQIERYRTRSLDPDAMIAANDHLFSCKDCFRRFQSTVPSESGFASMELGPRSIHDYLYNQLEAYVDGELSAAEKASFESHLLSCTTCRDEVDDLLAFKSSLTRDVPPLNNAKVRDAIELDKEGKGPRFLTAIWATRAALMASAAAILLATAVVWKVDTSLRRQVDEVKTELASLRASNDRLLAQYDADMKELNEKLASTSDLSNHSSLGDKVLRDGERVIRLGGGTLEGLEGTPLDTVEAVKKSLETGRLQIGRDPELMGKGGVLMGPSRGAAFGLIKPVGVTVKDKRPSFEWEAVPGALNYVVAIRNLKSYQFITSPQLTTTSWTPPDSLTRGQIYSWQVRVQLTDGSELSAPGPTEPVVKFKVLDESAERKIEEAGKLVPRSHLALAAVYARCGLIDEASAELRILVTENPDSKLARLLLDSVEFEKRQHVPSVNSKKAQKSRAN